MAPFFFSLVKHSNASLWKGKPQTSVGLDINFKLQVYRNNLAESLLGLGRQSWLLWYNSACAFGKPVHLCLLLSSHTRRAELGLIAHFLSEKEIERKKDKRLSGSARSKHNPQVKVWVCVNANARLGFKAKYNHLECRILVYSRVSLMHSAEPEENTWKL